LQLSVLSFVIPQGSAVAVAVVVVAVACPFVCHPVGICGLPLPALASLNRKQNVISTEAADSIIVRRAVESFPPASPFPN